MNRPKLLAIGTVAVLACTSSGCRLASLDLDGDGVVTRSEVISAVVEAVCGDDMNPDDGNTPDDDTADDGTTDDGVTDNGQTDDGTTDEQTDGM